MVSFSEILSQTSQDSDYVHSFLTHGSDIQVFLYACMYETQSQTTISLNIK